MEKYTLNLKFKDSVEQGILKSPSKFNSIFLNKLKRFTIGLALKYYYYYNFRLKKKHVVTG